MPVPTEPRLLCSTPEYGTPVVLCTARACTYQITPVHFTRGQKQRFVHPWLPHSVSFCLHGRPCHQGLRQVPYTFPVSTSPPAHLGAPRVQHQSPRSLMPHPPGASDGRLCAQRCQTRSSRGRCTAAA